MGNRQSSGCLHTFNSHLARAASRAPSYMDKADLEPVLPVRLSITPQQRNDQLLNTNEKGVHKTRQNADMRKIFSNSGMSASLMNRFLRYHLKKYCWTNVHKSIYRIPFLPIIRLPYSTQAVSFSFLWRSPSQL